MKNNKVIFMGAFGLLMGLFFVIANIYKTDKSNTLEIISQENADVFKRPHSPQYGDSNAKVIITEFLDPECESCRAAYPEVKKLLKEYEGKVKLTVRYAAFHQNSVIAITALEATRKQNKYWEALELLFEKQPLWGDHHDPKPSLIFEFLPEIGVNLEQLLEEMKDPKYQALIKQDEVDMELLKVESTPTFFVNGKRVEKFGIEFLKNAIDAKIKELY